MAAVKPEPSKTGKYIGIGVTIFAILFLSMIVALIMFASVGVLLAVIATVVAFTPAAAYVLPLIWIDRYDPEPFWLLALAFAWGALVAVIVSFFVNTATGIAVSILGSPEAGEAVGAVISAPIFEEGSKGLGLLILLIFFRRYFDDILDGIVFAGVIALGFATVENVLYYGRAIGGGGVQGLAILFVIRGVMSPFAHVTFTSMTGIGCGISRESHNKIVRIIMPVVGYMGAVALHAIWNGLAVVGGLPGFCSGLFCARVAILPDPRRFYALHYASPEQDPQRNACDRHRTRPDPTGTRIKSNVGVPEFRLGDRRAIQRQIPSPQQLCTGDRKIGPQVTGTSNVPPQPRDKPAAFNRILYSGTRS